MKFDRLLRPATEASWVVSYGCKTIPRWRTAAILKIDISPYLSEKSSDFHEILYTAADFELDERDVFKNEKSCSGQTPSSTERISCYTKCLSCCKPPHCRAWRPAPTFLSFGLRTMKLVSPQSHKSA